MSWQGGGVRKYVSIVDTSFMDDPQDFNKTTLLSDGLQVKMLSEDWQPSDIGFREAVASKIGKIDLFWQQKSTSFLKHLNLLYQ